MYYRGAKVAILVFSVINEESKSEVTFLANSMREETSSLPKFIIIGNKIDLSDKRVVTYENGKELAEQLECEYYEVSAKNGDGIEELLDKIGSLAYSCVTSNSNVPDNQPILQDPSSVKGACC
jgi:GTPase SAR1 family protein